MFTALFFGSGGGEAPIDPPVKDGHRGITVIVDGQKIVVDVDSLAQASGLFLQVQSTNTTDCPLEDFPGGADVFRQIVAFFTSRDEAPSLQVSSDNVLNLFEAAWLLECPRIFDEVMNSVHIRSLSSRGRFELLEYLLPFTAASGSGDSDCRGGLPEDGPSPAGDTATEEFLKIFLLETMMWQRTERAALTLASELDTGDFVLGPRLATGSLRVCCELLRLHQRREEESGFVSSALLPVNSLWKNLTDRPLRARVSWDVHLFALQCMRKRLQADRGGAPAPAEGAEDCPSSPRGEHEEDQQAKADLPDEVCEAADDRVLLGLVELVEYVDIGRAAPNWAALLIRMLMLSDRREEARRAFAEAFPGSRRVRLLAWRQPVVVPASWLADVAEHVEASKVLLRILGSYREMGAEQFCDIAENVLLEKFLPSPHCTRVILPSELVNDIVGACFDAGRKAQASRAPARAVGSEGAPSSPPAEPESRCPRHWAGQHLLWRLQYIGTRLFQAAFVPQRGFLPHAWPDCLGEIVVEGLAPADGAEETVARALEAAGQLQERACSLEPLVIEVSGHCLWDEGLLRIELLHHTMAEASGRPHEPSLHFGRQVIMRHLWYRHSGCYCEIPRLQALWELACWPLCEDAGLIREALEYLKGASRELQAHGASWTPEYEEALFQMFAALDMSRLPGQALLSPWVPPQVQTVRHLVQQQPAEQFHAELQLEVVQAMESLKAINAQCAKLTNRLNIVEQRTIINKSQIKEAIVAIEEHQRKKREAGAPPRRAPGAVAAAA